MILNVWGAKGRATTQDGWVAGPGEHRLHAAPHEDELVVGRQRVRHLVSMARAPKFKGLLAYATVDVKNFIGVDDMHGVVMK